MKKPLQHNLAIPDGGLREGQRYELAGPKPPKSGSVHLRYFVSDGGSIVLDDVLDDGTIVVHVQGAPVSIAAMVYSTEKRGAGGE